MWTLSAFCSFLDQIGSEESSCVSPSPPAASEPDSSDADVPAVRHTNITALINEAYEVRRDEVYSEGRVLLFTLVVSPACVCSQKFGDLTVRQIERLRCRHRIRVLQAHEDTAKENAVSRRRAPARRCSPTLTPLNSPHLPSAVEAGDSRSFHPSGDPVRRLRPLQGLVCLLRPTFLDLSRPR